MFDYLLASDGQKIYLEDIDSFFDMKKEVLKKVKSSAQFTLDAQNQDFKKYEELLELLKLSKPDGTKLEDSDVYYMKNNNMVGTKTM